MNQTETNLQRIRAYNQRTLDKWDESKHPRAANGQFGSGGDKSKKSKSSSNKGSSSKKSNSSTPSSGSAQTGTIKKESAQKATEMLKAAFNSGWQMQGGKTMGGKGKAEEMEKQLDDFWDYYQDLPHDLANDIYNLCWKSYHQDKHPDITEVMKLIGQLNKE